MGSHLNSESFDSFRSRSFEARSLPNSVLPSQFCVDHSHCLVLAPATWLLFRLPARFPKRACSISLIPSAPVHERAI
jgi:hypothetical protein